LNKLYRVYKGQVAFYVVYILEAHPIDAWQDEDNQKDKISIASAKSEADRCATAETCMTKLSIEIPPLVDDLKNSTERAYTGWPDRLYVIGTDGKIAYKSLPGPYGFKPAEVEATLKRIESAAP
jgi:Iodothyronine deiodinase